EILQQHGTAPKTVKSTGFDEAFQRLAVDSSGVHAAEEIFKRLKRTILTSTDDFFDGGNTDVLYRTHTESNLLCLRHDGKLYERFIDIWRQHFESHVLTFGNLNR